MTRIMFVCHGNICRSPMAEFVFRELLRLQKPRRTYTVASTATSREELGSPVHPGTREILAQRGISCAGKRAVQLERGDYERYDLFLGMDSRNITNMRRIFGGDPGHKVRLLMDFTSRPRDIADPWYSGDFERTYEDVSEGCAALLEYLEGIE